MIHANTGRVVVTGGAGFIGHYLVQRLARDHKDAVTVIDNLYRGNLANLDSCTENIVFHRQDIRDRSALDEAMRGCEVVFHLAAQSSVMEAIHDAEYCCATNVVGTLYVLHAARQAGVKRVVFYLLTRGLRRTRKRACARNRAAPAEKCLRRQQSGR